MLLCIFSAWIAGRITEGTVLWGVVVSRDSPSTFDTTLYVGAWVAALVSGFAAVNHAYRSGRAKGRTEPRP